jgi:uncharacterized delta-60 repeat protein
VLTDLGVGAGVPRDVVLQPNTDIVVSGGFGVARYLPTGKLDTTFGTGGLASTGFVGGESGTGVALQPDGKIIWVGSQGNPSFPAGGTFSFAVARFNANGTLDTSFGTGGKILSSSGGITALGLDAASNIFTLPTRAEFSPTGQADTGVTPAAITTSSHGGSSMFLRSGQFVQANTIGVAKHDVDVQVQRFNADGSISSTSPAFDYSGAPAWTRRGTAPAQWPSRPTGRPWPAERTSSAPASSAWPGSTRTGPWTPASAAAES